ncbi:MAG: Hemolysin A [Deltaproteobacteria bacterium ADurb.BinA179]|jgi:23S rRNA (cytidine1920-2'-O)/16S rRNA (cytidine1409-2'-O)-methyltransferase|nr:TlyA family RNA methyltransferase [Deltaproteobacteria bacterium]MDI9542727.1 TlyA family RNA methyltransferase [Pseudomonadota bacterium]OPZ25590.1 MAG: Hemolysin A [Deltaproteobacteria bacterium ADurb.BinA179]HNU74244.1 TlyA family RNA methyltransferase [Deltaproteobacteria bacterium]HOD71309.1 TlyA family RNA methyltransferase [Deltaproteobacteria bacterium]
MKVRLDRLLVEKGFAETRTKAAALIMAGSVLINGAPVTKAGTLVDEDAPITVKEPPRYVSRAGSKLEAALDAFGIDPSGKIAIDVGASTGGFTDVMLQRGAVKVYAVDVGRGQLHWKLRSHGKVVSLEGVNVRNLDSSLIDDPCDLATFDVSFISLKLVIPPVLKVLRPGSDLIALIKPQFEAGREHIGKGGILKDDAVAQEVIRGIEAFLTEIGCMVTGTIPSPVRGMKGNQEYLVHARVRSEK